MKKKLLSILVTIFMVGQSLPTMTAHAATTDTGYNYADAFAKAILFYEASWCGPDAGNNRLPWRGPCHVEDGKDVGLDLTGGFHDAGDHVKFGLPQAYAASTLGWAYYEFKDTFTAKGQDTYILKILKHFTDYLLKCYPNKTTFYYQCGDGKTDHEYWGPPEFQTTSRPTLYAARPSKPAADICGETAAALALMYINYKNTDLVYAEKCLTAAKDLYDFGKTYKGLSESGGFYGSTEYWDELSWAAIWLNIATSESSYLTDAQTFLAAVGVSGNNNYAFHWTHSWGNVFGGVFIKLAQITNNTVYKYIAEENLDYWMNGVPTTPGGLKYIDNWGPLRYNAAECMMALVYYKTTQQQKYLDFAKGQIDYMLGSNPRKSSYVVGFGNNYPKFPHHRAASGRLEAAPVYEKKTDPEKHLIYGALVGGPKIDDTYSDSIEDFQLTEVSADYNSGFVGAMAGITKYFGGAQMPEATPGIEPNTPECFVEANIMEENNQLSTIKAFIHNDSLLPPRFEKGLSFRYFVDLSEYYASGMTVNDITAKINYAPDGGVISKLIPWNEAKNIYYIEASWPGFSILGKLEFQFFISAFGAKCWDPTNDFSRTGLTATSSVTEYIPVYKDGVKIFGKEPGTSVNNSSIDPLAASFKKDSVQQAGIAVTITPNGNVFNGIKNGTDSLIAGTDYTILGNTVTILKSYLDKQPIGIIALTFDFSAGVDPVFLVSINKSTSDTNSTISPTIATFDKNENKQADIVVNITPNGNTLNGIKNGISSLVSGTDYTVSGNIVTILKSYLVKQELGTTNLTFDFSAGLDPVLAITISSTPSTPIGYVKVQMFNNSTDASVNGITPKFKLFNTGTTAINLSDIKIRYYFTIDGDKSQNFWCDYSTAGSTNVTGNFAKMNIPKTGADYYLEIGFNSSAGTLSPGQNIEIQTRFSKVDWSFYVQTGDYSFDSTDKNYVDSARTPAYISGSLQWGVEP